MKDEIELVNAEEKSIDKVYSYTDSTKKIYTLDYIPQQR
jgi:hypothetical protein